jgi:hypothetical protein
MSDEMISFYHRESQPKYTTLSGQAKGAECSLLETAVNHVTSQNATNEGGESAVRLFIENWHLTQRAS